MHVASMLTSALVALSSNFFRNVQLSWDYCFHVQDMAASTACRSEDSASSGSGLGGLGGMGIIYGVMRGWVG